MKRLITGAWFTILFTISQPGLAQMLASANAGGTKAELLRGTLNANRSWWNVLRYDVWVNPNYATTSIVGKVAMTVQVLKPGDTLQLDLQKPLVVDSVLCNGSPLRFWQDENICLVLLDKQKHSLAKGDNITLTTYYHGEPRKAKRPPWDGGWIWTKDAKGRPWMSVACQGLGASVWYPCKDHQSDEPDQGASLTILAPDTLVAVGNGRLISKIKTGDKVAWRWEVKNPINTYNLVPYIGAYTSFADQYAGEEGQLSCQYWVLDYELEKARQQFKQVLPMLHCFEKWFGPYPFYEDGYQLVQAPHLGMEHQSAVAYGNRFSNGYLGRDLSGSGWGSLWDYILIHESGHEWFGNNITTNDIADMWVHEGFTSYSEVIYTECHSGLQASREYAQGLTKRIVNDEPIIGKYGRNSEGSGDMYAKGAALIHTIRTIMQNDSAFMQMLRGLNKTFYHSTVTSQQIEQFIEAKTSFDCQPIFNQYLRATTVPTLAWRCSGGKLSARFEKVNADFAMPMYLPTAQGQGIWKTINAKSWTAVPSKLAAADIEKSWNKNIYVRYKQQ